MSVDREWSFRVAHILQSIERILRYTSGMTFEQFEADERTIDAVIRNFLVIGEAARHVPASTREAAPQIPWKLMEGMRHILVHDYETVRVDIVWKTVKEDLPPLLDSLRQLLSSNA